MSTDDILKVSSIVPTIELGDNVVVVAKKVPMLLIAK